LVTSGSTTQSACDSVTTYTIYGDGPNFDLNPQYYSSVDGDTWTQSGFFANSGEVLELDSTGNVVGDVILCSNVPTPTPTTTVTPTVTPSIGYYQYSLGTGATANDACVDYGSAPNTIYGTVAGGPGPNIGEYLYLTLGNPPTNPVANGYYSNGTAVFQVTGGSGQITSVDPTGC
jgi:hypothetical protein